jgi:hypothetical protein
MCMVYQKVLEMRVRVKSKCTGAGVEVSQQSEQLFRMNERTFRFRVMHAKSRAIKYVGIKKSIHKVPQLASHATSFPSLPER